MVAASWGDAALKQHPLALGLALGLPGLEGCVDGPHGSMATRANGPRRYAASPARRQADLAAYRPRTSRVGPHERPGDCFVRGIASLVLRTRVAPRHHLCNQCPQKHQAVAGEANRGRACHRWTDNRNPGGPRNGPVDCNRAAANHGLHQVDKAIQQATTPRVVALGQTVNVTAGEVGTTSGIRTVTVYSVTYPVDDSNGQPDSTPGKQYAAADIQVCAGTSGSLNGPDGLLFQLLFQDGQSTGVALPLFPKQPDIWSFHSIPANGCIRGFSMFEIANGTRPTTARYWPDPFHNYQWTLP